MNMESNGKGLGVMQALSKGATKWVTTEMARRPSAKQGKTSSNIFYLEATSMISAVPAKTHFAEGALVLRGAENTYVGPRRRCL